MKIKVISFLIITAICVVLTLFIGTLSNNIVAIAGSVIASFIILLVDFITNNYGHLKLYILTKTIYRNKDIRVSISYLFRIKVGDKYFLVKGNRIDQYAPVGGVFKRYPDSLDTFRKYNVLDDNFIPIDQSSKDDLRIRIRGVHLVDFIKWFKSGYGREVSAEREFYEELIMTGILDRTLFTFANYKFIKSITEDIKLDVHVGGHQILISEIYELILDANQSAFISSLPTNPQIYSLENENSIRRLGADRQGSPIGRHTNWIL
jgi:hypothetical protein